MCGTDCEASSTTSAPTLRALATTTSTGLTVPSKLDWWTKLTTLVRGVMTRSRSARSSRPSSVSPIHFSVAPVRWHQVAVVLHLSDDDLVTGAEGQHVREQVERLAGVLGEDDLGGAGRVDE